MSASDGGRTAKTANGGSQTAGNTGRSSSVKVGPTPLRRRRTRVMSEKKIADDEYMAAAIGDVEWLKQSLRENGGQINYDKNGLTAFHLAAIHGRLECLKLCINVFKFDINLPSTTGWRAVHLAISNQTGKRSLTCLTYILDKEADPSICNDDGISPVHQAASEGHVQCLKLLIERGARVYGKDCRGNTPLDLAKLWGHRKCARILAAEMWHQDKDHVATEMTHLKNLRMQLVLKEIEEEEELKAGREFYGNQAFKSWMDGKQLDEKPTGPQPRQILDGLYRPNSQVPQKQTDNMQGSVADKSSPSVEQRGDTTGSAFTDERMDEFGFDRSTSKFEDSIVEKEATVPWSQAKQPVYNNPDPWVLSTKLPQVEYLPILMDTYPRDEYTMMPKTGDAPKYFEGKHLRFIDLSDLSLPKNKPEKLRTPDLPNEVIRKVLAKDSSLYDRPQVFKPRHIHDVVTKKKYEEDGEFKHKMEAPLHMCNDFTSPLARNCLRFPTPLSATSSTSSKSSSSTLSDCTSIFPREMIINTMKQMSHPTRFPDIKGSEYVLHLGDVPGI